MSRMKTWLELFQIEAAKYPDPNNAGAVTYSGTTAWSQWDFGQIAFQSVDKLDKLPVDPLTEDTYVYSVTSTNKEYQLSWVMETDEYTTLNTDLVNANNEIWTLRVSWNYNGETIKVQSGTTTYVLAVPTIISTEPWDLMNLVANDKLAFDGYKNLPQKYAWWHFKQIWETQALKLVNASNLEIYSWNLNDLATDTTKQQALLTKLKNAYSWTDIAWKANISRLTNLSPTDPVQQEAITRAVIYWTKKSLTSDSISIATTAVTYTWCLATTQDGHSIPQLSHLQTSSHTSTGTVTAESTTMITDTYRCNNGTLEDIWQTTSLSCNTGYHDESGVCTSDTGSQPCTQSWAPANSTYNVVNVTVTWDGAAWSTPSNCTWTCNQNYANDNGTCTQILDIPNSLRFNDDDQAYLSRTPATAGNRKTWTWSGWVKRGNVGTYQNIFGTDTEGEWIRFSSNNKLEMFYNGGAGGYLITNSVYTNTSDWYHIIIVNDTTQAISNDRVKFYINGSQITSFANEVYPIQNSEFKINDSAQIHYLAQGHAFTANRYFDGYMSNVNFIDWQALDPSSFGMDDNGTWVPKAYAWTYGTNGFKLDFSDSSNIWKDTSGKGNDWSIPSVGSSKTITKNGTTAHSTNYAKFGNSSIKTDATSQSLTTPHASDISPNGSNSITFETWVYQTGSFDDTQLWFGHQHDWYAPFFNLTSTGLLQFGNQNHWGSNLYYLNSSKAMSLNTWHHVACTIEWKKVTLWLDGENVGTHTYTTGTWTPAWANIRIWEKFVWYLDEVRISDTIRYRSNFLVPNAPFISDSNTSLLIHSDTTNWSTVFTDSSPMSSPNLSDIMIDSPTNNFNTLDPLNHTNVDWTLTALRDWNLFFEALTGDWNIKWTMWASNSKIYFEAEYHNILSVTGWNFAFVWMEWPSSFGYDARYWRIMNNGNFTQIEPPLYPLANDGDIISIRADLSTWEWWAWLNWVYFDWWNSLWTINNLSWDFLAKLIVNWGSSNRSWLTANFGQGWTPGLQDCPDAGGKFRYCPPTGFKALSSKNMQ